MNTRRDKKMKFNTLTKSLVLLGTACALTACGGGSTGGGDDPSVSYETLGATTDTALATTALALDAAAKSTDSLDATFDGTTNELTIGGTTVALDSTSFSGSYDYAALLDDSSSNALFVVETDPTDLPSGSATYSGEALVTVVVGAGADAGSYSGLMDASVVADFASSANSVDVSLSNISDATLLVLGTPEAAYTATGSELIELNDLEISGTGFSEGAGSSAVIDGFGTGTASLDTSGSTLDVAGVFAGPNADEVAGVAYVDGTDQALITFIAD